VDKEWVTVIYEDEVLVAIAKPANVVVNRAESVKEKTIQDWMETRYGGFGGEKNKGGAFAKRLGMVHRLDKETSGVLVWAKTEEVMEEIMRQFKAREVKKTYVALVHGVVSPRQGLFTLPLGRVGSRGKFGVVLGGKVSRTRYEMQREFTRVEGYGEGMTLVKLYPETGRTHQLRVVLKHLGYPIVSDDKYLGKKRLKKDLVWCPRHFLHASKIELRHPVKNEVVVFEAPLSQDLGAALAEVERRGVGDE